MLFRSQDYAYKRFDLFDHDNRQYLGQGQKLPWKSEELDTGYLQAWFKFFTPIHCRDFAYPKTLIKMLTDRLTSPIYRPELLKESSQKCT